MSSLILISDRDEASCHQYSLMCSALLKQIQSLVGTFHDDADGAVVTAEYVSCHLLLFGTGLVIQRNYNTCVPRLSQLTRQNLELYNPSMEILFLGGYKIKQFFFVCFQA